MARPKKNTKTAKSTKSANKASVKKIESTKELSLKERITNQKFYDQLKLSESYVSLLLGGVVVIGVSVIFFVFIRESREVTPPAPDIIENSISPTLSQVPQKTYIMLENESLWDVAVREYGDGFRYTDIVEANPEVITNPDFVPPGTKIVIPEAK